MMTIKLYGYTKSTCTQRVLAVLYEKELDFVFVDVDLTKGEQMSPAHLARHPFGKVPALENDGFFIYESRAIMHYLAKKFAHQGQSLMRPENDFHAYGILEQAASVEKCYFNPAAEGLAIEKIFKIMRGLTTDEAKVKELEASLETTLARYDKILSQQNFVAGDQITVVDLVHLPYVSMTKAIGYAEVYNKSPNVKRWTETLQARDSWKKVTSL